MACGVRVVGDRVRDIRGLLGWGCDVGVGFVHPSR